MHDISKSTMVYDVIGRILALIKTGTIKPGGRLPSERSLAESFGVSRGSMRSATKLLAYHKVLEIRRGSGIYLLSNFPDSLLESFPSVDTYTRDRDPILFTQRNECRVIIEPTIARLAAIYITPEQLEKLESIVGKMEALIQSQSYSGYAIEDLNFHNSCAKASGNPYLHRMFGEYCTNVDFFMAFGKTPKLEEESYLQHKEIFGALRYHDPAKAEYLMREHVIYSQRKNATFLHRDSPVFRPGVLYSEVY